MDEASGLKKKNEELIIATLNANNSVTQRQTSSWNRTQTKTSPVLISAKQITRPQIKFKDKIDNSNSPFIPIIKDKPNSLKPLAIMIEINDDGSESYCHPYEIEIEKFKPHEQFLQAVIAKVFDVIFIRIVLNDFMNFNISDAKTGFPNSISIY